MEYSYNLPSTLYQIQWVIGEKYGNIYQTA